MCDDRFVALSRERELKHRTDIFIKSILNVALSRERELKLKAAP